MSQWVWNPRLELGHQLQPEKSCTTDFAPTLPHPSLHAAPPSGYASLRWACPGKLGVSRAKTSLSSPMGHCGVSLTRNCFRMNTDEKPMAVCAWRMVPAFAVAVAAHCASSVNGMALRPFLSLTIC
ncbi:hypothetical protein [Ktedonosporobacter rubrisoli]|uniref:hypothetical protein n=1 Tax=Ktedonosporobacter rubrisoli TaxID=2509675 RepID=UPI001A933B42|nr:hypothetical protein [Ktedonosporobacter rubrisoli]